MWLPGAGRRGSAVRGAAGAPFSTVSVLPPGPGLAPLACLRWSWGVTLGQSHVLCLEDGPSHRGGGGTQPLARGHYGPTASEKGADPNFLRMCCFGQKVAQELWVSSRHWTDAPDATGAVVRPGASGGPLLAALVLPTAPEPGAAPPG